MSVEEARARIGRTVQRNLSIGLQGEPLFPMDDYPELWVKKRHMKGCDGNLYRRDHVVFVDRTGRRGNGGIVAHEYVCNRHWAKCPARVLVAERTLRLIAARAIEEGLGSGHGC